MRQVPKTGFTKYALIGTGRVAINMQTYLAAMNIPYSSWGRKSHNSEQLENSIKQASHVLLLISDSQILDFINENKKSLANKTLVHFSGALEIAEAHSAHPLMTFSHETYELEFYKNIPFIIGGELPFSELLPGLSNPYYNLNSELKPLYHALCVASGNFTNMLWAYVFENFEQKLNLPKHVLYPYMEKVFINTLSQGKQALTGPIVRGDQETINKNLAALNGSSMEGLYKEFIQFYQSEFLNESKKSREL